MGCTNAKWPDLYGHYREAKFTQTKHHWWWKSNRIFNELRVTKNYNGNKFYEILIRIYPFELNNSLQISNIIIISDIYNKSRMTLMTQGLSL